MGQMIKEVQTWLNETYAGKDSFKNIPVTGETGWATTNALLVALQIELGISSSVIENEINTGVYSFGQETMEKCPSISEDTDLKSKSLQNISIILQGGFWCKGIAPAPYGSLTSKLTSDITSAIKTLQGWAGIEQTGTVTYLEFGALLSMNTFRIIAGGDSNVRAVQQSINGQYATDMQELIPCDGLVTRQLQSAFLFVLEMLDGFPAEACRYALQPDNFGYFAPNLLTRTPIINQGDSNDFVSLLQHVLYCSGYKVLFTGLYDQQTADAVLAFKLTMMLGESTEITGETWESLLTSHGYSGRPAKGCDTSTTLTLEAAQNLKAAGYEIVGRYLTDRFKMTVEELENIFKAGLRVFPIFETYGTYASYFTAQQGTEDAYAAFEAAKELGIPGGTIIYFGVDCDILDGDVSSTVIPYFQGINNQFRLNGSPYKIGVYGARNICNKTKIAGLTEGSFVSDMSAGYSGNIMNFPMPKDWAFNQFATVEVGGVSIDKDAYSGVDTGFGSINPPVEQPTGENVGCDTGYVISSEEAIALANNGYKIVGRIINGENALTLNEIANIEAAGLSIVPIYVSRMNINEDVFWNKQQGTYDAVDAINIAKSLNIPSGKTIYFTANYYNTQAALDYVVNPYFSGVKAQFTVDNSAYKIGIYGPRNACLSAEANGTAVLSFVEGAKNIKYGNEGYKMPSNWAFNQYGAGEVNGLGINKDTVSGKDNGFRGNESTKKELLDEFNKIFGIDANLNIFREAIILCEVPEFTVTLQASSSINSNGGDKINISADGNLSVGRIGSVNLNLNTLQQGLYAFASETALKNISEKLYSNGVFTITFGISNISPFTVNYTIKLAKDDFTVSFIISVIAGEDGDTPNDLPNAELVQYFNGLTIVLGGAYSADEANGAEEIKKVLESISVIAGAAKVIEKLGEGLSNILEWLREAPIVE